MLGYNYEFNVFVEENSELIFFSFQTNMNADLELGSGLLLTLEI